MFYKNTKPIILGPMPIILSEKVDEHTNPSIIGKRPKVP
jgi:hypothetical protein